MISTESRMISGLRRISTPSAPVTKSSPASTRYQVTSGPCIALLRPGGDRLLLPRVRAEDDAADRGHEEHDRGDLEGEQVVGQEERPDRRGRPERAGDVRGLAERVARLQADRDHDLDEDRAARSGRADRLPRRPAGP